MAFAWLAQVEERFLQAWETLFTQVFATPVAPEPVGGATVDANVTVATSIIRGALVGADRTLLPDDLQQVLAPGVENDVLASKFFVVAARLGAQKAPK